MSPHPFLLALPCLLMAAITAHSRPIPDASVSAARDGNPEPGDPDDRKLVPGTAFDGYFSLNFDYPVSEESGGIGSRAAMLARWNPAILGWDARLAAGWIFWEPLGPITEASGPHTRLSKWSLVLDEAWLRYPVQAAGWTAAFQAGVFRWRSHADAALTGEYLARWGAYPVQIIRQEKGYEPLDSLTTDFQGLRFALASPGRMFGQEVLAVLDTRQERLFLTLIGTATFAPLPGLEAAIGAALHEPLESRGASLYAYPALDAQGQPVRDTVTGGTRMRFAEIEYRSRTYSARMTIDLATWITGASRADRGGRLYAEAALLGWEDYPFYYADKSRRIQFSAGLNLPAFGILDVARLQAERRSYPSEPYNSLRYLGGPETWVFEEGPSHWWSGRLHLARALLPWLEVQGLARCERRRKEEFWRTFAFVIPVSGPEASPQPDPVAEETPWHEETLWSFEARITARL